MNRNQSNHFVLSVEGASFMDRGTWSTHKVVGVFGTYDEAVSFFKSQPEDVRTDEDIWLITDLNTAKVTRC